MRLLDQQRRSQAPVTLSPAGTVRQAAELMAEKNVGSVIVMEGERLAGIFTERDLLNRVVAKGRDLETPLLEVMSRNVVTVEVRETLQACYDKMQKTRSRHVPIVEEGKVVGMVTMRNLLEWLWKEIEEENIHLMRYIQQS